MQVEQSIPEMQLSWVISPAEKDRGAAAVESLMCM